MNSLDQELLSTTLEYAANQIPFYSRVSKSVGPRELQLDDFPIIDRTTVSKDLEQFLNLDQFPDYVISSGGTLSNSGAFSFRCQEEYEAVHYYMSGKEPRNRFQPDPERGFSLDIFNNSNGYHWRKPPGWPTLAITLEQQAHAEFILRLLRDGLYVNGQQMCVKHVQGQCGPMRALTGYFQGKGIRAPSANLSTMLVFGSHLTKAWKRRYKAVWGVDSMEMYGLSEFTPGNALKCKECGCFHFWTCWPEFLNLDTEEPILSGDARLVLTSLVPFARIQPRIRYLTGDIVSLSGLCPETGKMGFKFRGRISSSVVIRQDSGRKVLFSEIEVLEVLEQMAGIAHHKHACERNIWETAKVSKPEYDLGYPRYQIEIDRISEDVARAKINIEVTFDYEINQSRRREFLDKFVELLMRETPGLEEALSTGTVVLDVELFPNRSLQMWVKTSA